MKKEEKAKVGRPKLADSSTKKNAYISICISLVLTLMLVIGGTFSLIGGFDVNLLKGKSNSHRVCYEPNGLKVVEGGRWCHNVTLFKFSLKGRLTPVVNDYNDKKQYNRAIIGYTVSYTTKTAGGGTVTYYLTNDYKWRKQKDIKKESDKKLYKPDNTDIRLNDVPEGATVYFNASWIEANIVYVDGYTTVNWNSAGAFRKKAIDLSGDLSWNLKNSYNGVTSFSDSWSISGADKTYNLQINFDDNYVVKDTVKYNENFTVKFDKNDNKGNMNISGSMSNQTVEYSKKTSLTKNAFTSKNYKFRAWRARRSDGAYLAVDKMGVNAIWIPRKCDSNGKNCHKLPQNYKWKEYKDGDIVSSLIKNGQVVTMVAQWEKIPTPVKKTTKATTKKTTKATTKKTTKATTKKTTIKTSTKKADAASKKTFTIVFNPNGTEGDITFQKPIHGVKQKLNKNTYVKEGYNFVGWIAKRIVNDKEYYRGCKATGVCSNDDAVWTTKSQIKSYFIYNDEEIVAKTAPAGETAYMYAQWRLETDSDEEIIITNENIILEEEQKIEDSNDTSEEITSDEETSEDSSDINDDNMIDYNETTQPVLPAIKKPMKIVSEVIKGTFDLIKVIFDLFK